jgi:hypothetical protein
MAWVLYSSSSWRSSYQHLCPSVITVTSSLERPSFGSRFASEPATSTFVPQSRFHPLSVSEYPEHRSLVGRCSSTKPLFRFGSSLHLLSVSESLGRRFAGELYQALIPLSIISSPPVCLSSSSQCYQVGSTLVLVHSPVSGVLDGATAMKSRIRRPATAVARPASR